MIDTEVQRRLQHIHENSVSGRYGSVMAEAIANAGDFATGVPGALQYLDQFCSPTSYDDEQFHMWAQNMAGPLFYLYCRLRVLAPDLSVALATALIGDFPGKPGTKLLPRWEGVAEASGAYKQAIAIKDRGMLWQAIKESIAASAEFINGLLPFLIVSWQAAHGLQLDVKIFEKPSFGAKRKALADMTKGDDGIFYAWFRCIDNNLRNAIAHKTIWQDQDDDIIHYQDLSRRFQMPLAEFALRSALVAEAPRAFMAMASAAVIIELGSFEEKLRLPASVLGTFVNVTFKAMEEQKA